MSAFEARAGSRVRIAQLIDRVRLGGGAERLQSTFAESLDPAAVELTVITLNPDPPSAVAALRERGVRVVCFPAASFANLRRARAVLRFIRAERFDLIHAHLVRSTILAGIVGWLSGTPVVATLHNTERSDRVRRVLQIAESWILRHVVDRVIAVGWETARAHGDALGARAIDVIPNAVGVAQIPSAAERAATRRELGISDGAPLVLAIGRLVPQKAFSDLLRAFAALPATRPAPQLRIVGRGRLEGRLAREIEQLGLSDRAQLLGLRSDVPRLLGASDLYASSSHWEGSPVAMLEAMAAGLPVVATDVGDVPRVLDSDSGLLVPPQQPEALARAIAALLADPTQRRRLGAGGRARVLAHFGSRVWADRHMALYAEVVGRRPGAAPTGACEETPCAS